MDKKDGGPAFPTDALEKSYGIPASVGLSIRDYLAAAAIVGVHNTAVSVIMAWKGSEISIQSMALDCYEFADAMLAAREAK